MKRLRHRTADEVKRLIGARIRERRTLQSMTLEDLSEMIGLSMGQVARYETGETPVDTVTLVRLALALNCSVVSLMADFMEEQPAPALPPDVIAIAHAANAIKNGGLRGAVKQLADGLAKWEQANGR
jgi:transcriptional regulator with XRE-family HTH domain